MEFMIHLLSIIVHCIFVGISKAYTFPNPPFPTRLTSVKSDKEVFFLMVPEFPEFVGVELGSLLLLVLGGLVGSTKREVN